MPTITARRQANGSTRYPAAVRLRRGTTVLHQESRTFTHHSAALSWAKHREVVLEDPAALERHRHGAPTIAELIRSYIDTLETVSRWQRSRQTRREFLDRRCPDGGQARPGAPEIVQQARTAGSELRLIGEPRKRTRRPTTEELARLRNHFRQRDRRASVPMQARIDFGHGIRPTAGGDLPPPMARQ